MEDKDIGRIIGGIVGRADYVICAKPDYYRSADPEDLMRHVSSHGKKGEVVASIPDAIERAKALAGPGEMILVTGSLFTVGEALTYFDPVKYRPDGI
jgi:dihydrofolate synthase/folylpolyglutamate synthase